jgi:hypothetical protein
LNGVIVVPWITVSPVQLIPGWTCDSRMIGPPAARAAFAGRHSPASTKIVSSRIRNFEGHFQAPSAAPRGTGQDTRTSTVAG